MKIIKNIFSFLLCAYTIVATILFTISILKPRKYHTVKLGKTKDE